jgi:hypothetical protein
MSGFAEAIRGYQVLGEKLVDDWSAYTKSVVEKVNGGDYTANTLVKDAVAGVKLSGWSWFLVASEAVDAIANIANDPTATAPAPIYSRPQRSPLPGAALTLNGDFLSFDGKFRIPVAELSVEPAQLAPAATTFRVRVAPGSRRGATYTGTVTATPAGGAARAASISVWLTIR